MAKEVRPERVEALKEQELDAVLEWSGDIEYVTAEQILQEVGQSEPGYRYKRCPFCGQKSLSFGEEILERRAGTGPCSALKKVWAICDYCGATGPKKTIDAVYPSEDKAASIERWNTRKGPLEKVYGYTLTNSEGFSTGQESLTRLFPSEEEALYAAFDAYLAHFNNMCNEKGLDSNGDPQMSFNCFTDELQSDGYVVISGENSHLEISYIAEVPGGDDNE